MEQEVSIFPFFWLDLGLLRHYSTLLLRNLEGAVA